MTPERTRELLENCALACGYELMQSPNGCYWAHGKTGPLFKWNPLESSADEAEMESLLRLDVRWLSDMVVAGIHGVKTGAFEYYADHPTPQLARMMAGCRAAEAVYLERGK